MPNQTKFNAARRDANKLFARIDAEINEMDLDHQQDVLEELAIVCRLKARDVENALIDAEGERLHACSQAIHPSLSPRERNPSLR